MTAAPPLTADIQNKPSAMACAGTMRILMLATDAHGGFGGIAQYNRDILDALSDFDAVKEVVVVPRIVADHAFTPPPKVRYDLSGVGGQRAFITASLVQALRGGRFSLVYCAHINLLPLASLIARIRQIPLVLAIYGIDAWRPPRSLLAARCARKCRHVISISQITLDRFQSWSGGARAKTSVVPNAIRAENYGLGTKSADLAEHLGIRGRRVIMTFGRMAPEERYKGFDEIIEILPRLRQAVPDIVYLAAGDGADRPRLEAKVRELGISDLVVFTGRVPEIRKADYYRLADLYVMPSSGEGFGFVVLEALACGIPVVASNADGTREAVRGGALGRVVSPDDPVALQAAIVASLEQSKAVPPGIEYFSFANFGHRLRAEITRIIET